MPVLDAVITRYGSVASFRANGTPRDPQEVEEAWLEADAWFAARAPILLWTLGAAR